MLHLSPFILNCQHHNHMFVLSRRFQAFTNCSAWEHQIRSKHLHWIVQFYNLFTVFHFHFSLPHLKIASYTTSVAVCLDLKPILWHCHVLHAHSQLLRMPGRHAAVHMNGIFQKGEGLQTLAGPPRLLLHKDFCPLVTLEGKKLHEICSWSARSNDSSCQA